LERHLPELKAAGLTPVNIGIGEVKHARHYCGKLAPSQECLTEDGATTAYGLYGLREGTIGELLNVNVIVGAVRAVGQGHLGGAPSGNARMMPGTFIVDSGGVIRYAYYSKDAADHPPLEPILAAARALSAR
jgi:hypothetical protein